MNNQIKNWAIEANPSSKEIYESESWPYNCAAWSGEDVTNLVKLIRQKCIEAVENADIHHVYTTHDFGTHQGAIAAAVKSIKENVNVE